MADCSELKRADNKYTVLSFLTPLPESLKQMFADKFNIIRFGQFTDNREKYGKDIVGVVFTPAVSFVVSREFLDSIPNLKVFSFISVGYDNIDLDILKERGIKLSNSPGVQSESCADHVFALMLIVSRRIFEGCTQYKESISNGVYRPILGREVTGSSIGILGMGSIGCKVAERAKGFRMKVLYHNRRKRSIEDESALGAVYVPNLKDMLPQVDFLVICCPLSSATKGIIGANELEMMKSSAILVNISRGGIVDTDALVDALQRGVIRGAGLDVTNPEPLPMGHPLLSMPNVTITPHSGSATIEVRTSMVELCIENLINGIEGKPMPSEICM